MLKRLITFFALIAVWATMAIAHDFEVDGIYYVKNSDGTSVSVSHKGSSDYQYSNEYSGSVTIPPSVTYLGKTYSVTSIAGQAFRLCSKVTSVSIPNSVTSIGGGAFYNCSGLTSVTIGNSVTSIGNSAFYGCSGLTKVKITDLAAWCGIEFGDASANPLSNAHHLYLNGSEIKDLVIPNSVKTIGNWAFKGCSSLTSVTIPNSVTSIGNSAFSGCSGLTTATIGNSVTSIGDFAFWNCSGLTSVTIPNSVTSIGEWTFVGCSGLTSVTIGNSVTEIGEKAFDGTPWYNNQPDGLIYINNIAYKYKGSMPEGTSVSIKEGTVSISPECFRECRNLTSITIPNSVTYIGSYAFYKCSGLKSIEIPNSVTTIGDRAFYDCSGLTNLVWNAKKCSSNGNMSTGGITSATIGNEVEILPDNFLYGSKITEITIPNSVTSIGEDAFWDSGLTSVTIPNSVTSIGDRAFNYCFSLTNLVWNAKNCSSNGNMLTYLITSATIGNEVEILPSGFLYGSKITSITIPNSVTSIGDYAFYGCSGLTSVTIPKSVTSIGDYAFQNCSGFKSLTIPNSVTSIGSYAFKGCGGLTGTLKIPNYVKAINDGTFEGCSGLTSVTIPNTVTSIGNSAFAGCSGLTSMAIPNSVTSIGDYAFQNCSGLTSMAIPNSVTSIGSHAFERCEYLDSVTIPNSVTSIGDYAFQNCSGLRTVNWNAKNCSDFASVDIAPFNGLSFIKTFTFGNEVEKIPAYLCRGLSRLTSVTIPKSVTSIGNDAFNGCSGLTSLVWNAKNCASIGNIPKSYISTVTIGNSVETLPAEFAKSSLIREITIPNSVTLIGNSAFADCRLMLHVTIGSNVKTIEDNAFNKCKYLIDVTNYSAIPQKINANVFGNIDLSLCHLYVPENSYYDYTHEAVWKDFLVEAGVEGVEVDAATKEVEGYHNLQGIRLNEPARGQVNIVRYKDGTSKKIVVK